MRGGMLRVLLHPLRGSPLAKGTMDGECEQCGDVRTMRRHAQFDVGAGLAPPESNDEKNNETGGHKALPYEGECANRVRGEMASARGNVTRAPPPATREPPPGGSQGQRENTFQLLFCAGAERSAEPRGGGAMGRMPSRAGALLLLRSAPLLLSLLIFAFLFFAFLGG